MIRLLPTAGELLDCTINRDAVIAMNAATLRRLFAAVSQTNSRDARKVCERIVQEERERGHGRLAEELSQYLAKAPPLMPFNSVRESGGTRAAPFVQDIPRDELRHLMVLPERVESKFLRIEKEFAASNRLRNYGLHPRRRILLHGPPGCGKSMGAERLAWNTGLTLRRVRFETLLSSYFGETASNLHKVFTEAAERPIALFLDECDTIASSRTLRHDVGEVTRIVNTLLQLLEEYEGDGLVIAATNLTANLDRALFRRFDEVIEMPLPAAEEIARLLMMTLGAMEKEPGISWIDSARELDGHSYSDVVRVAQNAAKHCILEGRTRVSASDLAFAMSELNRIPLDEYGGT